MFFKKFVIKDYPLFILNKKKKKLLRQIVDETIQRQVQFEIKKILKFNFTKKLINSFDKEMVILYLNYALREKIYPNVCHNVISEYLDKNKKISHQELFRVNLKEFLKSLYVYIKTIFWILNHSFIKQKNKNNIINKYDIVVQYIYGSNNSSIKDFPISNDLNKEIKILNIISDKIPYGTGTKYIKDLKKNYITKFKKNPIKKRLFILENISKKTHRNLISTFYHWFKHPYLTSLFMRFIKDYEFYNQLFNKTEAKIYVHTLTHDKHIVPIRQSLMECGGKNISFQRSYFDNHNTSYLQQSNEILFCWGKGIRKNLNIKKNYIKKTINTYPDYLFLGKKKKAKKNNQFTISFFDTSLHDGGVLSVKNYNLYLEIVLQKVINNKNINLIIKYKNSFTKNLINKKNLILIKKLKLKKRFIELGDLPYKRNFSIITSSDLVLSISSISVAAEALFHKVDSLCFCNSMYNGKFLKKINQINPFAFKDLQQIEIEFNKKINFKSNKLKINKLHNYFFKNKINIKSPKKIIQNIIKN